MNQSLSGVFCNTCKVIYQQQRICAVKGSSVIIPCSFYCPEPLRVKGLRWVHAKSHLKGTLIYGSNFKTAPKRFHFIRDNRQNCSLKILPVERNDAGKYTFRLTTNSKEFKWSHQVGSTLKVVGKLLFRKITDEHTLQSVWFETKAILNFSRFESLCDKS